MGIFESYEKRSWQNFRGETLKCLYYKLGESLPVAIVQSDVVSGEVSFLELGTTQVICPAPNVKFELMRIGRIEKDPAKAGLGIEMEVESIGDAADLSEPFPVCRQRDLTALQSYRTNKAIRHYNICVCTASDRFSRDNLVEWLEYHRLLGVEHFFIYNTAPKSGQAAVFSILHDYIKEGLVTIVAWSYSNCVRGMASGRPTSWTDDTGEQELVLASQGYLSDRGPRELLLSVQTVHRVHDTHR